MSRAMQPVAPCGRAPGRTRSASWCCSRIGRRSAITPPCDGRRAVGNHRTRAGRGGHVTHSFARFRRLDDQARGAQFNGRSIRVPPSGGMELTRSLRWLRWRVRVRPAERVARGETVDVRWAERTSTWSLRARVLRGTGDLGLWIRTVIRKMLNSRNDVTRGTVRGSLVSPSQFPHCLQHRFHQLGRGARRRRQAARRQRAHRRPTGRGCASPCVSGTWSRSR